MKVSTKRRIAVALSGIALSGLIVASPQSAMAEEPCATQLDIQVPSSSDAIDKTPIVTIHGLWGDRDTFSDMKPVLEEIENSVVFNFDYELENDRWVTNSDAAHRLAETIACFSLLYDDKDVVLVTHSMGGLLAREALDWAADGTFVKDVVGHVITIAPPHEGSLLANVNADFWLSICTAPFPGIFVFFVEDACREIEAGRATSGLSVDSEQLAELPKFPESVTVKTIAGHATWRVCAPWGCSPGIDQNGDLVVSVDSATAEYTEIGVGDGKTVFECDTNVPVAVVSDAWCEHSNMLQAEQVQYEVKASIEAYLGSIAEPEFDPDDGTWWTFFDKLAIPYLEQDWGGAMSEPEYYVSMRDFADCPESTNAGCPAFYFTNLDTIPEEYDDPRASADEPAITELQGWCEVDRDTMWSLLEVDVMNIGDKIAEFYTLDECPTSKYQDEFEWNTMWVWYVKDERVLISASDSVGGTLDIEVMEESFRQAVWF
jgi:pimeloyl-ACP methyl ester carboxylesterase